MVVEQSAQLREMGHWRCNWLKSIYNNRNESLSLCNYNNKVTNLLDNPLPPFLSWYITKCRWRKCHKCLLWATSTDFWRLMKDDLCLSSSCMWESVNLLSCLRTDHSFALNPELGFFKTTPSWSSSILKIIIQVNFKPPYTFLLFPFSSFSPTSTSLLEIWLSDDWAVMITCCFCRGLGFGP